jgi:hypothetical protein
VIVNRAVAVSLPPFAVPPSSRAVTVTVAWPTANSAGVNARTPRASIVGSPPGTNSAGLSVAMVKDTCCFDSFAGPGEMSPAHATAWTPSFSNAVTAGPGANVGGSFTGSTSTENAASVP